ncbi:hypothetical protein HNV11_23795 (plasmid) [Spirosoma taeanense]|uniref:Uncharacterized protein n=1 Tax=Spirosoma taeanense TaxID=2735870 RepID=A0A6M5YEV3_9BACT|nr:hypothetical protein [Spirosoma taeanense]QJW92498.1 hypothetical protein HNV11_23795 [Spirosoma taeanense]
MKSTPKLPQPISQEARQLIKPYQYIDRQTGEVKNGIKYVEGQPLNIRFNGQTGRFTRDGQQDLGPRIEIVPVCFRAFKGSLFGRQPAKYVEVFYVDGQRNLCVVLFTNATAENFVKFAASLYYSDNTQTITNSRIAISAAVRIRKSDSQRYHVAEFENLGLASPDAVDAFRAFGLDHKIYRAETRNQPGTATDVEDGKHSSLYFPMWGMGVREAAPADAEEARQLQASYTR